MRNHMAAGWFYSPAQIRRYLATRPTSLKPPGTKLRNPVAILRGLDRHQWLMFTVGTLGWVWDSFDFATVTLCVTEIAADFDEDVTAVSWGITVTLMLRAVGALLFGALSDRYGRKWTLIANLFLFIVFELASGFAQNLHQFIGVRALYGIAMGGLYAPAVATALEDLPTDANGILSGVYQQGASIGGLLAAVFYRALVPTTYYGWRSLFWFGAAPPILIIAFRLWLPETNAFLAMRAEQEAKLDALEKTAAPTGRTRAWLRDVGTSVRQNWVLFIYMTVLMTGVNFCSHGAMDIYPTFTKNQVGLGPTEVTIITVVGAIGSIVGGAAGGYVSTFTGRRLAMIASCVLGAAALPAAILPRSLSLAAGVFFVQFFIGASWGPVPIYLSELSPPALRATAVGLTYQLGNLASSASATIEATFAERYPLPAAGDGGALRYDYGRVIAVFVGVVWACMCNICSLWLFLGPEMSEEERAEYNALAKRNEALRKQGANPLSVGPQGGRTTSLGREQAWESDEEKGRRVEYVE